MWVCTCTGPSLGYQNCGCEFSHLLKKLKIKGIFVEKMKIKGIFVEKLRLQNHIFSKSDFLKISWCKICLSQNLSCTHTNEDLAAHPVSPSLKTQV